MELAARGLDAGAFKLWCYFAKNQNDYQFALSSADAQATMGIKIKQYNNAVAELIEKQYLVPAVSGGNHYDFFEVAKPLNTKQDNADNTPQDNYLSPCGTRNTIYNTLNNTKNDLPYISITEVKNLGLANYKLENNIITFETGVKYNLTME